MSTFAHMNTSLVFNPTLRVELPRSWTQLFSETMQRLQDNSLQGVQREVYEPATCATRSKGEMWSIPVREEGSPKRYHKVTAGSFQMYVLSGTDSVLKNGQEIFIRPGQKVSFHAGDTFSFSRTKNVNLAIFNQGAQFTECSAQAPSTALRMPSYADVEATRALLGLHSAQPSHAGSRSMREEETSSRAYRGNRRPY